MGNRVMKRFLRRLVASYYLWTHTKPRESYLRVLVVNKFFCCYSSVTDTYKFWVETFYRINNSRGAKFEESRPVPFSIFDRHIDCNLAI